LKVKFLGTGTSQGVPVIACTCKVCLSANKKDKRLRTSALLSFDRKHIVIDAGPDFRQQMLRAQIEDIEAVLITHEHNDHIIGLDDVRPFNFKHEKNIPIYSNQRVLTELEDRFPYIFHKEPYPGAPRLDLNLINKDETFHVSDIPIQPVEVMHGKLSVLGFRIHDFCYITDAKTITTSEKKKLKNLDVLILNALHHEEHHSHLNLSGALALINEVKPHRAYLTHISHRMGLHNEIQKQLPDNVFLAYDGLEISSDQVIK